MNSGMRPLALVGIVSALVAVNAHAQSKTAPPAQVTTAVTVVAQREPVITVVAPRETPSDTASAKRQQPPTGIGNAVDADGDGIADAPATAARAGATGRPSGKRSAPAAPATQAGDCDDKEAQAALSSACAKSNPLYKDKGVQGENPLHAP
jgi:hypothetical protein